MRSTTPSARERSAEAPQIEDRSYEVDGLTWHVRAAPPGTPRGRRPAVVLLQGLIVSGAFHEPLMERLAPEFDVYAPDIPGYGQSEAPTRVLSIPDQALAVARWIDAAGLRPAAILGTSYGAQLAAELAANHPEHVARVVLVSPTLDPAARPLPSLVRRWLSESGHEIRLFPQMVRDAFRAGPRRSIQLFRMMRAHRIEEAARRIRAPVLVVKGALDPLVTEEWARELAEHVIENGRLIVLPGQAHPLNFIAPVELANVVRPFLHEGAPPPEGEETSA